ncbi:hypothetical protein NBRC116592_35840 [Colwellia sp. KU-HH00111]|uniref:hypothetical protein n=1 Tax=Colwellia sp. KU-HH00111 TaxID=3127652 RepID=UPI0031080172
MKYTIILLALVVLVSFKASSEKNCSYIDSYGNYYCISRVNLMAVVDATFDQQYQSQWCWAASLSNVFDSYNHPVSQQRIVEEAYGGLINLPAQGFQIAQQLNKTWIDDYGNSFSVRLTGAYDYYKGVYSLNNQMIVDNLTQNKPLIIGTNGHAMTLYEVAYYETFNGPNFIGGSVYDPWPNRGWRQLTTAEFTPINLGGQMQFLVTATLTSINTNNNNDSVSTSNDDSGGTTGVFFLLLITIGLIRNKKW